MSMTREQMNTITDFVDLEMKLANARNEEERHMYMRILDALNG